MSIDKNNLRAILYQADIPLADAIDSLADVERTLNMGDFMRRGDTSQVQYMTRRFIESLANTIAMLEGVSNLRAELHDFLSKEKLDGGNS